MSVTTLLYFSLAALAAIIYQRLPARWRIHWLLLISVAYIATWSWHFVLILLVFSLANFYIGKNVHPSNPHRKALTRIGIVINLAFLLFFKYSDFYQTQFSDFMISVGALNPGSILQILLPVGLSFLVVQGISYLLDVANDRMAAETSFILFCTYVFYFPKLTAGPVERARELVPRLVTPLTVNRAVLEQSAALIVSGLLRKIVIGDSLFNMIPAQAFFTPLEYAGQNLVFWLVAYAFALYNDFAGYTAIVRGVSLWFGIRLSLNFNLPYLSRNFTEFWNRWHISLSSWLRDYIFYPLSWNLRHRFPSAKHIANILLPPMVTMLVSGMWHGLRWNMLLWGGLHGLFMVLERIPSLLKKTVPVNKLPRWQQRVSMAVTFIFAIIAWVPFRMSISTSLQYWKGLFIWQMPDFLGLARVLVGWSPISEWSSFYLPSPILILILCIAGFVDYLHNKAGSEIFLLVQPRWLQVLLILTLVLVSLLAFFSDSTAPFVYQGF